MTTAIKTLSQTPAAIKARLRRALKAAAASPTLNRVNAEQAEHDATVGGQLADERADMGQPGSFAAMAATLAAEQAEAAEDAAIAAIKQAKAPRAPSVRPADNTRYTVGAYKGRSGAMYEFMKRAGQMVDAHPHGYTREEVVASCTARPPHAAVSTRAGVLDYFAWAVRHGLLVVAAPTPPAAEAAPSSKKTPPAKATPAARRSGSVRKEGRDRLSRMLTAVFSA